MKKAFRKESKLEKKKGRKILDSFYLHEKIFMPFIISLKKLNVSRIRRSNTNNKEKEGELKKP